ncbi:hypothetical protein [Saccharopolyspora sp. 6V]|uniref:hypothetical protein n=1 Tax=Saccharopolyspora sp. 6V TaxID=2877239 RepID=UPI001CD69340|nr:hypothetical protein [Saccharopolyspora sp. 6V]MCA1192122.1 hypothetical protein [Saccharopolyspora sp. 6V]
MRPLRPAGTWTDADGRVHVRDARGGSAFCGIGVDRATGGRARSGCADCVAVLIESWGRDHSCGPDCRPPLPRREPGAALDRRLARSGRIEADRDLPLLERVRDRLRSL